jgi:hypothetical protein
MPLARSIGEQVTLTCRPDAIRDVHDDGFGRKAAEMWRLLEMAVGGILEGCLGESQSRKQGIAIDGAFAVSGVVRAKLRAQLALQGSPNLERRREHRLDQTALNGVMRIQREPDHRHAERRITNPFRPLVRATCPFASRGCLVRITRAFTSRRHGSILAQWSDTWLRHHPEFDQVLRRLQPTRTRRGRPWSCSLRQRLVVVWASLKMNLTIRELAHVFELSKSQVHRVIDDLVPRLAACLAKPRIDRRTAWIVDGTLVPTRDHAVAARSKNYRWSCNLQIIVTRDLEVVAVGGGGPGNRNDVVHYRDSVIQQLCTVHRRVLADGGYRGIDELVTPRFRRNRIVRDASWRRHRRRRARVEHALARLKDWRILRDHRRRGKHLVATARAIAVIHNLRIQLRDKS